MVMGGGSAISNELIERYDVQVAVTDHYANWIHTPARRVNLNNPREVSMVHDLSDLMTHYRDKMEWGAVSSNNLHWNRTKKPLRIIQVPDPEHKEYMTIVNPRITEYNKWMVSHMEGCGVSPGNKYWVLRSFHVHFVGNALEGQGFKPVELDYGFVGYDGNSEIEDLGRSAALVYVQHECDHIDGIVIPEIGIPNELAEKLEVNEVILTLALMRILLEKNPEYYAKLGNNESPSSGTSSGTPRSIEKKNSIEVTEEFRRMEEIIRDESVKFKNKELTPS